MFDHVTIKVKNLAKSKAFYEKAFAPLGFAVAFGEEGVFHAFDVGQGMLFEIMQYNGNNPITSSHIAFRAKNREQVQVFYDAALQAGAVDNGQPGPRKQYTENYFACFILDPDGHNIEVMHDRWE